MEKQNIYEDIARRTDGDVYIGVVGPVRTGKSTFIKRFMETLVLPNIDNPARRDRARDELPQSGSGKTVMTSEPKFVPEEAVSIRVADSAAVRVRLIDCVGYMVPGAIGQFEDGRPRMVNTPWFDEEIPMTEAAEIGTQKVINDHSSIGMVVTTDGTITEIPREDYLEAEERVINELKALGKPFLVVVNSVYPESPLAQMVCDDIANRHGVACLAVNCMELDDGEITKIIKGVLFEFPVAQLGLRLPSWVDALSLDHPVKSELYGAFLDSADKLFRIRDIEETVEGFKQNDNISGARIDSIDLGTGTANATIELPRELFYRTLGEQSGFDISDDGDLMELLSRLSEVKTEYDKIEAALKDVREQGYGIVMPTAEELTLEEPEIVKQGGRYGVRLRASAPSIHIVSSKRKCKCLPELQAHRANYLSSLQSGRIDSGSLAGVVLICNDIGTEDIKRNNLKRVFVLKWRTNTLSSFQSVFAQ